MSLRERITTAALLGSSQPLILEAAGSPLDSALIELDKRDPSQRTLDAIALILSYEGAGATPRSAPEPAAPSEADPRPLCSPIARGHLAAILANRRPMLPEWLSLLEQAGLRPPEELVPALLDAGHKDHSLRPAVLSAAGPLGGWLAPYCAEWSWVKSPGLDESLWETGTPAERLALLQRLRASNPERGRQLVESTWKTDPADAKRQFIDALAAGLSLADEDFLESALDERSIVVRRSAAAQLAALPNSKLSQRMFERLKGRLSLIRTGLLKLTKALDVKLFETLDDAAARDGIDNKSPAGTSLGERGSWTAQALACVDPAIWTREWKLDAAHLLEAAKNGQWNSLLLEGWRTAAIRHRRADWLDTLAGEEQPGLPGVFEIFHYMSADQREQTATRLLKENVHMWMHSVAGLCPHPWSLHFTRACVSAIAFALDQQWPVNVLDVRPQFLRLMLRAAALLASPQFEAVPANENFTEFNEILSFRRGMRHALLLETR